MQMQKTDEYPEVRGTSFANQPSDSMIAPEHVEASLVLEVEKVLQAAFEQTLRESLAASEQRLAQAAMAGRAKELEAAEARIAALQARARSSRAEIECAIIRAELALEEANPKRAAQTATGKETREGGQSRAAVASMVESAWAEGEAAAEARARARAAAAALAATEDKEAAVVAAIARTENRARRQLQTADAAVAAAEAASAQATVLVAEAHELLAIAQPTVRSLLLQLRLSHRQASQHESRRAVLEAEALDRRLTEAFRRTEARILASLGHMPAHPKAETAKAAASAAAVAADAAAALAGPQSDSNSLILASPLMASCSSAPVVFALPLPTLEELVAQIEAEELAEESRRAH